MAWRIAGLALLAVLAGSAATAGAQVDPAPPVEVEDVELPGLVEPLSQSTATEMEVRVGCEVQEVPETETTARLSANRTPDWANAIISPSTLTWKTAPGDCPSSELPFRKNVTVAVSADQDAPGYEPTQAPIEVTVEKTPPAEDQTRSYGPHRGNLSFTPGYFHLHNVRLDTKIEQVAPNETARFEGTVDNHANYETEYRLTPQEVPDGIQARVEPNSLVLTSNETGDFAVEVEAANASLTNPKTASVPIEVQGNSTHPDGGEGGKSQVSVLAEFTASPPDPRDSLPVPALGPVLLTFLSAAAARVASSRAGA